MGMYSMILVVTKQPSINGFYNFPNLNNKLTEDQSRIRISRQMLLEITTYQPTHQLTSRPTDGQREVSYKGTIIDKKKLIYI